MVMLQVIVTWSLTIWYTSLLSDFAFVGVKKAIPDSLALSYISYAKLEEVLYGGIKPETDFRKTQVERKPVGLVLPP